MSLYLGNNLVSGVATPTEPTRNLGQIIESLVPLTDAGLHLLDGALINGSGIYSAFVTYIAGLVSSYPDLFDTEANWQQSVTDYGVCGKFVYDSTNNTVRLPKVTGKLDGTTDLNALGDLAEQYVKLPNITGTFYLTGGSGSYGSQTGAFYLAQQSNGYQHGTDGSNANPTTGFDASRCSSVYSGNGTDTEIHEQAINVLYYIVIATTTKTEIEVDIDEIATDLNGKADVDLTNVNNTGASKGASWAMPSGTYTDLTLGSSGTNYIAPSNGFINFIKGASSNQWVALELLDNNDSIIYKVSVVSVNNAQCVVSCPVRKNGKFKISYNASGATASFRFIYAAGSESEAS